MKPTEHIPIIYQFYIAGLAALCFTLSLLLNANAQTTITTDGEDSKLERSLSQPTELLLNLGISVEEIDKELAPRPRILIKGAGFVHNTEVRQVLAENSTVLQSLAIPREVAQARLQVTPRIVVKGAGSVRGVRSIPFTDFRQTIQRIIIKGAGFARSVGLVAMPTLEPPPTATLTATPTGTPLPTNTPSATPATTPTITTIRPNQGNSTAPNTINVRGRNFQSGATVRLGDTTLTALFVDPTHLRAEVPLGLDAGVYNLTVTNPDGGTATLANAYTVIDAATNDDLSGYDYELLSVPAAPHAGAETGLTLKVHRLGGKQALPAVKVRFYLGDPQNGGTPIGDGTVAVLSPNSADNTTAVLWTPPTAGDFTIYAVIDPDNAVAETYENNNVVQRTITVLSPAPDVVAPRVDSFTINDGAATTAAREVTLRTTATDEEPGSGVAKLLFVEFEFSQGTAAWIPVRTSEWLDYTAVNAGHTWPLVPASGMKYLQAWAADNAGNISVFPAKAFINFLPPLQSVAQNQRQIYRFPMAAGEVLSVRLEAVSGDPDLYIWAPDHETRAPWISNLRDAVDDLEITAPIAGNYQVEVNGFSAAQYRLIAVLNPTAVVAAEYTGGVDPTKVDTVPGAPPLSNTSEPSGQFAIDSPGTTAQRLYLPVIQR